VKGRTEERDTYALLVVAPNWLGDLVMSTVLLQALAAVTVAPSGRRLVVDLAIRRRWAPLMTGDPRLRQMLPVARRGEHRGLWGLPRLAAVWRRGGYEGAILLPPSLRVAAAAVLAGIPQRTGFRGDGRGPLLCPGVNRPPRGMLHYSEETLLLGRSWAEHAGWPWSPQPALKPALPACAELPVPAGAAEGPPIWVLATTASYGMAKGWPAERAAAFVEMAVVEAGVRVLLLGDEAARTETRRLRSLCHVACRDEVAGPAGVVDLVGRTDLREVSAWLRVAAVCISIDSGLMHLAAALGTATLGLFGSTSPAWTGPRGRWIATLAAEGFACQPCFRRRCNQKTFCMESLSARSVLGAARALATAAAEDMP
jgi:heptosyltransferase-2